MCARKYRQHKIKLMLFKKIARRSASRIILYLYTYSLVIQYSFINFIIISNL